MALESVMKVLGMLHKLKWRDKDYVGTAHFWHCQVCVCVCVRACVCACVRVCVCVWAVVLLLVWVCEGHVLVFSAPFSRHHRQKHGTGTTKRLVLLMIVQMNTTYLLTLDQSPNHMLENPVSTSV